MVLFPISNTRICLVTFEMSVGLFLQAVGVYEDALAAVPTARMFSMYATYLQDRLSQSSPPQPGKLSKGQAALVQQQLQLCKRAYQAGPLPHHMFCLPSTIQTWMLHAIVMHVCVTSLFMQWMELLCTLQDWLRRHCCCGGQS